MEMPEKLIDKNGKFPKFLVLTDNHMMKKSCTVVLLLFTINT